VAAQLSRAPLGSAFVCVARYKVLQSVAHSLAHSFTSALNWGDGDYVMGNLLLRAREDRANTLEIDLISGAVKPAVLVTPPVQRAVGRYSDWLRRLVANHHSDMRYVLKACLTIRYNLALERPNSKGSRGLESPYECTAQITDDRGKTWSATLRDWWAPGGY